MRIYRGVVAAVLVMSAAECHAAVTNWTVQSASSSLTLSASVSSGGTFATWVDPQGPGSYVTTYSGTITTQQTVDAGVPVDIQLLSSVVSANNGGDWEPLPGGGTGTAPANYGFRFGEFITLGRGAFRDLALDYSSSPLALIPSPYTWQSFLGPVDTELLSGTLEMRGLIEGSYLLSGTDSFTVNGTVDYGPTLTTLNIYTIFDFTVLTAGADTTSTSDDVNFYFTLTGSILASAPTESVPEANSFVLLGLAGSVMGFLGYRRKTTRISSKDSQ